MSHFGLELLGLGFYYSAHIYSASKEERITAWGNTRCRDQVSDVGIEWEAKGLTWESQYLEFKVIPC